MILFSHYNIEKAEAVCYDSYRNEENLKDRKK